jgi:hypothetical protein
MEEVISHGAEVVLMESRTRTSVTALDDVVLTYCVPRRGMFVKGGTPEGFPGLRITDLDEREDGGDIIATVYAGGLVGETTRRIGEDWRLSIEGWDECLVTVVALDTASFTLGSALSGSASMFLVEVGKRKRMDGRWSQYSLVYQGIKDTKLTQRSITVNEDIYAPSDPIIVDLPNGWDEAAPGEVSMPRVVVTDTITTSTAPNTAAIPGNATPPDAPTIQSLSIFGPNLRRVWPNEWKIASMDSRELYKGAGVYILTISYEYVWPEKFN